MITISAFAILSCGDDDKDEQQEPDAFLGCCSPDPVFGANVENLDQSAGEIRVIQLFTPNGDGYNDWLNIENIDLYPNHTVTIYNLNDEVLFESNNYGNIISDFFPQGNQGENGADLYPDGTYKYKIVVEDETVFMKSGTFCLFTNNPVVEPQNFSECDPLSMGFDPIISGL